MRAEPFVHRSDIGRKAVEWLGLLRDRTRPRPDLSVEISRCALLVIDMLRYFAHSGGRAYIPSSEAVLPGLGRLLQLWRGSGGTVVFTRHCHSGPEDLGMLGRFFVDHIRCGERDSEIIRELEPLPTERVYLKNTYDAFHGTGLEEYLLETGLEQVLITGVLTQMCCETTARSAFVKDFEVFVPVDALTTTTEELHLCSLMSMASCCAVMTSTEELLNGS
ncbi:MAG: hypothetical protein AVO35_09185 [Candidatus Aegiribacteria sp. MLS_C]|nr:MAG: hypothetical protein AVO35_09185 [Candidatus Aegiribacteria sp. MLS_C]